MHQNNYPTGNSPFDQALEELRISGCIVLNDCYTAPFAITVPKQRILKQYVAADLHTRVIPFHYVVAGEFALAIAGKQVLLAKAGDMVICPSGDEHQLRFGRATRTVSFESVLNNPRRYESRKLPSAGDKRSTELICGVFMMRNTSVNPLLSALPAYLRCSATDKGESSILSTAAAMLKLEVKNAPSAFTRARVLEVFCGEALRSYQSTVPVVQGSWLGALNDPRMAAVLNQLHAQPERDWSIATLAQVANLSASRFATRFRDTVGMTAMDYLTRWRMELACRQLSETQRSLASIAASLGYNSAVTFSRAFRSALGITPAKWRAQSVD